MIVYSASACMIATLLCIELIKNSNQIADIPLVSPITDSLLQSDECTPDLANILDVDLENIPEEFVTCVKQVEALKNKTHPDANKNTSQLITSYGYPVEVHTVTTKDGYILTVHRIPKHGKIPVFLQHGLGGCSDNWLFKGNDSLAFLLSNFGYDVWLGNFRGTKYSLGHTSLKWNNPTNFSYWDFSFHELGKYDVPAVILYIKKIKKTTDRSILYIGHSMGTTSFLVGLNQTSDVLNDNIKAAILLAPGGFMARSSSVLRFLAPLATKVDPQYLDPVFRGRIEKPEEFFKMINSSVGDFCTPTATRCGICTDFLFAIFGFDAPQVNYTDIPNLVNRYPNTMSVKTLWHYGQSMDKCTFRQFDYGPEKNKKIYGTDEPADYSLNNCKVPVYSMYANFDTLFRPKDVIRTLALLPKDILKENIEINWYYFTHADFVIAKDVFKLVNKDILRIFKGCYHLNKRRVIHRR